MIKLSRHRQLRKLLPQLRRLGEIFTHRLNRVQIKASLTAEYDVRTNSAIKVSNAYTEVEVLLLTVQHEIDFPCRWVKGQVIEIDHERFE